MEKNQKKYQELESVKEQYRAKEMTKEQVEQMRQKISEAKKEKQRKMRSRVLTRTAVAAAAAAAAVILLPNVSREAAYAMSNLPLVGNFIEVITFRDYQYEDERHRADIQAPELKADQKDLASDTEQSFGGGQAKEKLKKTTEEINEEIRKITDEIVKEFEANVKDKEGYQDVVVKHETIASCADYFVLKLICYQGAGSGAEWDYFYTVDLTSGERLGLSDLFVEGADYIAAISEDIKEQMQRQMAADENVFYWVDNEDVPEWNFEQVTDETSFYLNQEGKLVICFNEGDVAPMYMGCVEFVISDEALSGMWKR